MNEWTSWKTRFQIIANVEPPSVRAGSGDVLITVYGSNFVEDSMVQLDGSERGADTISTTRLTFHLMASDVVTLRSI